ncbi:unnamed protein product [Rotaria sp. Silwood1]|nr:unnamed protein product [Rotaria sp. Silwood1]
MDFDLFTQPPAEVTQVSESQNTNYIQEDDFFGTGNMTNPINTAPVDTVSNNPPEDSWVLEDNFNNTTTSETNILSENTLTNLDSASPITSFDDSMLTNPSNINELNTSSTNKLPSTTDDDLFNDTTITDGFYNEPATNDVLYNDQSTLQSEETSSYDMFSQPVSSSVPVDTDIFTTGISSEENLSALEAFNKRRQQEINEKDEEERKKIDTLRQQAKNDLERWYQERKLHMEKNRLTIQNAEDDLRTKSLEKSDKNICDWGKVLRFIEVNQGTQLSKGKRDLSRMKACIFQAKRENEKRISTNGV